jgi:hypothetical protein
LGVPFVFILGVLAAIVAWWRRAHNPTPAIAIAAALGLANPLCSDQAQPANLYQLGGECSFRSEVFASVLEVDAVISAFDPHNEARWVSAGAVNEEPPFDGHDFCNHLSAETAARSGLLTHYFYTSAELIHGVGAPSLKKATIVATSPAQLRDLVTGVQASLPPGYTLRQAVLRTFPHSKFTLTVAGYDIISPSQAGGRPSSS